MNTKVSIAQQFKTFLTQGSSTMPIVSKMGGRLKRYGKGGIKAPTYDTSSSGVSFGDDPNYSSTTLEDTPWGQRAKDQIFSKNFSTSSTATAPTASKGPGWMGAVADAAPYVSNLINSFRKLPTPYRPVQESYVRSPHVSLAASRNSIERFLRSTQEGNRQSVGNRGVAAANNAAALAQAVEGNNQVNQQEANTNAQIDAQTNYLNSMVGARNAGRSNEYNSSLLNRSLAQQQLKYDNIADLGEKFQLQRRDKALMKLENRKLDILPELYKDTGVYDRNLTSYGAREKYPYGGPIKDRIKAVYPATTLESRIMSKPSTNTTPTTSFLGSVSDFIRRNQKGVANINASRASMSTFAKGGWIQGAVNPAHKGYCTPMTKATCTPRRKALARTFKKHHGFHKG